MEMIRIFIITLSLILVSAVIITAQTESGGDGEVKELNATITCEINGVPKSGDECLESLKKFGKIVGYIISGVIVSIIFCCCICWCCICKTIFSKRSSSQTGQVFSQNNGTNLNDYNRNRSHGNNVAESPAVATIA